jgi:hypothetical protein
MRRNDHVPSGRKRSGSPAARVRHPINPVGVGDGVVAASDNEQRSGVIAQGFEDVVVAGRFQASKHRAKACFGVLPG